MKSIVKCLRRRVAKPFTLFIKKTNNSPRGDIQLTELQKQGTKTQSIRPLDPSYYFFPLDYQQVFGILARYETTNKRGPLQHFPLCFGP